MKTIPSPAPLAAALLVSALALPSSVFAFAEVARGALTLTTTGRVSYDSNIVGNTSALSDTFFTLAPTLRYSRAAGLGTIDASLGVAINRYLDLTSFNSEDIDTMLHVSLPTPEGAREEGNVRLGYTDLSRIDETVGTRIRAKTWSGGFTGTYRAGTRVDLRAGLSYSDSTRDRPSGATATSVAIARSSTRWSGNFGYDYTDFLGGFGLEGDYRHTDTENSATSAQSSTINQTSDSVSSGLFYRFASGLRASANLGYRWLDRGATETASGATSSNGMTFGLRLTGPFLPPSRFPKLKSSFAIGFEKGESLGLNSSGSTTLVGNLSLSWQARERTAFSFNASRSQGLSTTNQSTVDDTLRLSATQRIGDRTSLSASLGQDWSTYPGTGRSDRRTRGGLDLGYALNRYWQASASYSLTLSRSTNALVDYDRHLVSASVSYTF